MHKRRILFLINEHYYFASHKRELAAAALEAGFDVYVAARSEDAKRFTRDGYTVIPVSWERSGTLIHAVLNFLPDVWRVRRMIDGVKPDILHNIALKAVVTGSMAAWGLRAKVVNSINGFGYVFTSKDALARIAQFATGLVLRLSTRTNGAQVVLQNSDDAAFVKNELRVGAKYVQIIRGSGIDVSRFHPQPLPSRPFKFLVLSRLLYMKGVQVAVAAFRMLKARGVDAELVICGGQDPGNPSSIAERDILSWATIPGVKVLGHTFDVKPIIAGSHVVLQPALGGEGLPRALLEAGAMERGSIATDIAGNREVVVPGETGVLVPANSPQALANAMEQAVAQPGEWERMGKNARVKVEKEFSADQVRAEHAKLYRELIGP